MEKTTQLLEKLEKESIQPYLTRLAELKISVPLRQDQYLRDTELMQDLLSDLEEIYKIAMKQRACQQLVSFVVDKDDDKKEDNLDTLKSYASMMEVLAAEEEMSVVDEESNKDLLEKKNDEIHTQLIKNLLDKFFESKKDVLPQKENMSLVYQIDALKEHEAKLKKNWEQDLQVSLDTVQKL